MSDAVIRAALLHRLKGWKGYILSYNLKHLARTIQYLISLAPCCEVHKAIVTFELSSKLECQGVSFLGIYGQIQEKRRDLIDLPLLLYREKLVEAGSWIKGKFRSQKVCDCFW